MKDFEALKKEVILKLKANLYYPETTNEGEWHKAEQINQVILNTINEILKL